MYVDDANQVSFNTSTTENIVLNLKCALSRVFSDSDFRLKVLFRSNTNRLRSFSILSLQCGNALLRNFQGFIYSTLVDSVLNLRSKYWIMNELGVKT